MREWEIHSRVDLSERQGFLQPRWGSHFNGRIQERILGRAVQFDARAAVQITLNECRQGFLQTNRDQVLLSQVFDTRFRVLQSCPHHLRGRFRQAARCALEARHEASIAGDLTAEHRAWKLFCLLLFKLLRKLVVKDVWGRVRFDMFNEGKWMGLVEEGISEVARRILTRLHCGTHVAQQKMQQGEVSRARTSRVLAWARRMHARAHQDLVG